MKPIVIVGPRGVGKTTAARLVARALARPLVDLDAEIERAAGRTVAALFALEGEPRFREREAALLATALARRDGPVIAPGGGAVVRVENRDALARSHAVIIYISATPGALATRIESDAASASLRPSLAPGGPLEEARALLQVRGPLYRAVASVEIATDDLDAEEVAERIVRVAREHAPE